MRTRDAGQNRSNTLQRNHRLLLKHFVVRLCFVFPALKAADTKLITGQRNSENRMPGPRIHRRDFNFNGAISARLHRRDFNFNGTISAVAMTFQGVVF
jgi:hypothetical protein